MVRLTLNLHLQSVKTIHIIKDLDNHSHNQRFRCHDYSNIIDMVEDGYEHYDRDTSSFKDMLEDTEKPLYPGAKHSKLSSLMRLYNVRGNYG